MGFLRNRSTHYAGGQPEEEETDHLGGAEQAELERARVEHQQRDQREGHARDLGAELAEAVGGDVTTESGGHLIYPRGV
jgi:hypothetical protein